MKPWEKYGGKSETPTGPWSKYQTTDSEPVEEVQSTPQPRQDILGTAGRMATRAVSPISLAQDIQKTDFPRNVATDVAEIAKSPITLGYALGRTGIPKAAEWLGKTSYRSPVAGGGGFPAVARELGKGAVDVGGKLASYGAEKLADPAGTAKGALEFARKKPVSALLMGAPALGMAKKAVSGTLGAISKAVKRPFAPVKQSDSLFKGLEATKTNTKLYKAVTEAHPELVKEAKRLNFTPESTDDVLTITMNKQADLMDDINKALKTSSQQVKGAKIKEKLGLLEKKHENLLKSKLARDKEKASQIEKALKRQKDTLGKDSLADGNEIADDMLKDIKSGSITSKKLMHDDPKLIRKINKDADFFRDKSFTMEELMDLKHDVTKKLTTFYNQNKLKYGTADDSVQHLLVQESKLKQMIYDRIPIKSQQKLWGQLEEIKKELLRKVNIDDRFMERIMKRGKYGNIIAPVVEALEHIISGGSPRSFLFKEAFRYATKVAPTKGKALGAVVGAKEYESRYMR